MFDIMNNSAPDAIDAGSAVLMIVEAEHRVVEHIESVHAELELGAFGQGEIFQD